MWELGVRLALGQIICCSFPNTETMQCERKNHLKGSRWKKGLKMGLVVLVCDKSDRNKHTKINKRLI